MQSELAYRGYTVICVDDAGEFAVLEIPYTDTNTDTNTNTNTTVHGVSIDYRGLLPRPVAEYGAPFSTSSYLNLGFSLGGSVGTYLLSAHDEVLASLDYDGSFFDTLANDTVNAKKPSFDAHAWPR
ncbi:hypothetical protein ST47_g9650 [Ascochyta rabiei]|uniref:Hydrolase n=1 Tax=Didymella rabiei TaxID=5454 RepID=A0A162WSI6_DIDRA|nr:hypothetical protein ST47_g9650 [Ascochyta rabiei]